MAMTSNALPYQYEQEEVYEEVYDFITNADDYFTEVFYDVQRAQESGKRFFVNYGGGGSSKSVSQHQNEIINLLDCDYDILFMRKVGSTIYDSCYKLLENMANDLGIYDEFKWNYSNEKRQILNERTGRRILFRGADDIDKLKSIVGIGRVILEEADAFEFSDFKEINRRARGFKNIQIVFILNPVDEQHWIKTMFVDKEGAYHGRSYFTHSNYRRNKFLTADDKRELELLKLVDENEYNIYALGLWGRLKTGSEFYPQFSELQHTGKFPYLPHLPAHLSYDFNVVPYMTMLAFQYIEEPDVIRIRCFREYCLKSPMNTTTAVTEAFLDDHEKWLQTVFYYGDASGNSRIPGKGDQRAFDDVRNALVRYVDRSSDRVSSRNAGVLKRRKLMMRMLSGQLYLGLKRIIFEVDKSCVHTIEDFKYLKIGPNGKEKEMFKDKKTGVSYQRWGHASDATDYFCATILESLL